LGPPTYPSSPAVVSEMAPTLSIRQEEVAGNAGFARPAMGRRASRPRSLMGRRGLTGRSRSIPASVCGVATRPAAHVKQDDSAVVEPVANIAADAPVATTLDCLQQDDGALSDSDIEDVLSLGFDDDDERAMRDVVNENIATLYNDFHCQFSVERVPGTPCSRKEDIAMKEILGETIPSVSPGLGCDAISLPLSPSSNETKVGMEKLLKNSAPQHCSPRQKEADVKPPLLPHQGGSVGGESGATVVAGRGAALWDSRGMRATRIKRSGHSSCSIIPSTPKAGCDGETSRDPAKGSGPPPCLPKQRPRPAMLQTAAIEESDVGAPSPRPSQPVGTPLNACRSIRTLAVEGQAEESGAPDEKQDAVARPVLARSSRSLPSLKVNQRQRMMMAGAQATGQPQGGW